jgi:hypothetical protein
MLLAPPAYNDSRGDGAFDGCDDAMLDHAALLALLDNMASSTPRSSSSRSSAPSSVLSISWCSHVGSEAGPDSLGSGPPLALTHRNGVVFTVLEDDSAFPAVLEAPPPVATGGIGEPKCSSRLASKESQLYEPVEVRAIKMRGLKDALGRCTSTPPNAR